MKEKYLVRWPTLLVGIILLLITALMFFFLPPTVIQSVPPQDTYLLFYLPLYFGLCLTLSYALLHSRRGVLLGTFLVVILWLNQVRLYTLLTIIILAIALSLIELLLTLRN